jgi:hypothetical protein
LDQIRYEAPVKWQFQDSLVFDLYAIQPRRRPVPGALFPPGAKDDPSDAELLLDLLTHHRPGSRRVEPIQNRPVWYRIWSKAVASW